MQRIQPLLPYSILLALTAIVYAQVLDLGWIWDDDQYVTQNTLLQTFGGLTDIWLSPSQSPQYYPAVFTLLWLEFQCFAQEPMGYHAVNVMLHGLNACVCYKILSLLDLRAAFWIACAFALHPIQVESVAWVTEIKNLLSALFYGCAWITLWPILVRDLPHAAVQPCKPKPSQKILQRGARARPPNGNNIRPARAASQPSRMPSWIGRYLLGSCLFLVALLSKSVTASLPAAMFVAIWFYAKRNAGGKSRWAMASVAELKSLARPACLLVPLAILGAGVGFNTARLEQTHVGAQGVEWSYSTGTRFIIAARSVVHYVQQVALPFEQMFFYPRFSLDTETQANVVAAITCAGLIGLCIVLASRGVRGPIAGFAFFCGSAFPALGFLNVYPHRFSFVADHFVYVPVIGLLCIYWTAAFRISEAARSFFKWGQTAGRMPLVLILVWYAFAVNIYLPTFTNEITLWEDTLSKNPECPAAMQNLGLAYARVSRPQAALETLERATRFEFDQFQTWNSIGLVQNILGNSDKARQAFEKSVELNPDNAQAWLNLASVSRTQSPGVLPPETAENVLDKYRRAWAIEPSYLAAFGLASIAYEQGDMSTAARWFAAAAEIAPSDIDAQYNLAQALHRSGRIDDALLACEKLLERFPGDRATQRLYQAISREQSNLRK